MGLFKKKQKYEQPKSEYTCLECGTHFIFAGLPEGDRYWCNGCNLYYNADYIRGYYDGRNSNKGDTNDFSK